MQTVRKNTDIIVTANMDGGSIAGVANWADDNGRNDKRCFGEDELV